jgi:hypothetical protein
MVKGKSDMEDFPMEHRNRSKKFEWNGETFTSKKEFDRYQELLCLQRAGNIRNLERRVELPLLPSQRDENGYVIERAVAFVVDFTYFDIEQDRTIFEDAKEYRSKEYILKRKMMLYLNHIVVHEV